jgi:hypothetical protein
VCPPRHARDMAKSKDRSQHGKPKGRTPKSQHSIHYSLLEVREPSPESKERVLHGTLHVLLPAGAHGDRHVRGRGEPECKMTNEGHNHPSQRTHQTLTQRKSYLLQVEAPYAHVRCDGQGTRGGGTMMMTLPEGVHHRRHALRRPAAPPVKVEAGAARQTPT